MASGPSLPNALPSDMPSPSARPLRLVSISEDTAPPGASTPLAPATPALRRLQRELTAAHAEARSLRELLEELPAILERKFQQRLQALLLEQRQLERDNALLQQHLLALAGGAEAALASAAATAISPAPPPSLPPAVQSGSRPPEPEPPITRGLGLRRALRSLHR